MTTTNFLIADALGSLGVIGSAETVQGNDGVLCLRALNRLLDAWRQQPLMATHSAWVNFTLPANTQTRTIGPAGQVVSERPISIEIGAYTRSGGLDQQLEPVGRDVYAAISQKTTAGGTWPSVVYYEAASPAGTLYFWPLAGAAVSVFLPVRVQLTAFADLTTAYTLPDGYEAAIVPSLAEKLAPYFKTPVPRDVAMGAAAARRAIKRANGFTPQLDMGGRQMSAYGQFLAGG